MTKSLAVLSVVSVALFTGCSNKINLSDYRPMVAQKNEAAPKNLTEHKLHKVAIIEFQSFKYKNVDPSKLATNKLKSNLTSSKFVQVDKVLAPKQIDEYVKLAEVEQEGDDAKTDYHIIKGSIQSLSYTPTYHPTKYIKIKNKTIVLPEHWSYDVCSDIQMDILAVPSLESKFSKLEHSCISHDGGDYQSKAFFPYLINDAVKESISQASDDINKFFVPKGYILEVKRNEDDIIAKISLGYKQGVHKGMEFVIYDLQKDKDTGDINRYKIGSAEVGENTINANTSWITVDLEDNQELKIGDLVIPDLEDGFLSSMLKGMVK